jgi:hypothetical protein
MFTYVPLQVEMVVAGVLVVERLDPARLSIQVLQATGRGTEEDEENAIKQQNVNKKSPNDFFPHLLGLEHSTCVTLMSHMRAPTALAPKANDNVAVSPAPLPMSTYTEKPRISCCVLSEKSSHVRERRRRRRHRRRHRRR